MNVEAISGLAAVLARIDAATTSAGVIEGLTSFLHLFGLRHLLIARLPRTDEGLWPRPVLYDGWPAEWSEHYTSSDHFSHDPCVLRSRVAGKPFLWSELSRERMSIEQLRVMDEATEFAMLNGLCVPVYEPCKAPAVITVAGDRIVLGKNDLPVLEMVSTHAFRALQQLRGAVGESVHKELTHRERDILSWTAAGKSAEDVGCILSISKLTVERHLSNIREKLDATNSTHAAVKALLRGDIHL
ncbi:LuxR family transcriptional regulator [Aquamicrobium terrae]|uniref:LuxR family quorum sensing-dependent transcriptional regulator n=1 Tax=Aquamicrobium terrae TaxID=1324945 RepID=A0ABV2N7Z7_9HYPH